MVELLAAMVFKLVAVDEKEAEPTKAKAKASTRASTKESPKMEERKETEKANNLTLSDVAYGMNLVIGLVTAQTV
jgi:hypothetical protein